MKKKVAKIPPTAGTPRAKKDSNQYPLGWDLKRVQSVIAHYDKQSEDEAVAEDETAYHDKAFTMMAVPIALVPQVRKLIGKRAG